jgi:hypothetical protein
MNPLEERIIAMAAAWMLYPERHIGLDSTLQEDLGMEEDDAQEFFEEFEKEFPGDYSALDAHWHRHFLPEPTGLGFPIWSIPVAGLAVIPAIAIHAWQPWIPGWLLVVAFVLGSMLLSLKIHAMLNPSEEPPLRLISIQDLVEAAETRKWPLPYSSEEDMLPSDWPSVTPPQN